MRRRLDITLRAVRALQQDPAAPAAAVQDRVLSGGVAGTSSQRYSVNAMDGEAEFLEGKLRVLYQVGPACCERGAGNVSSLDRCDRCMRLGSMTASSS